MSRDDLDRVRADLGTMKALCLQPAIPREDILASFVVAIAFAALAVAVWFIPMFWIKLCVVSAAAIGAAAYVPWKRRILRSDAPRRHMEIKELAIWGVAAVGGIAYVLFHRFVMPGGSGYAEDLWQSDVATIQFFLGLGGLVSGLAHRARRTSILPGIILITSGLLLQLATSIAATLMILSAGGSLACLAYAAGLAWLIRHQRSENAPD